ncbi:MAG: carboxylate--amine ligase [Deltaproteobacteria bacterium HGW-Deltaproteobacteria-19]|jgi:acetyl-CoA synthetase (ADP-forming)|nr:MAG: carboxylate--amine ligase [Deltaproteobacteria bacterium HGW-Deltaproteobacteria-19]
MNRESAEKIIEGALGEGRKVLSEYESKRVLEAYGIPVTREVLVCEEKDVPRAAAEIGYPLVMKGCSAEIAHKTEKGLIRVDVRTSAEALAAFREIKHGLAGHKGGVLIQEMVRGRRELVMGLTRDGQFGPCVMFGLGGIFTEILKDIAFRRAPLSGDDAMAMMREIRAHAILDAVRGMEAADRDRLADMLISLGQIGMDIASVLEIDLNPVILSGKDPIVVDALIVLSR